MYLADSLDKMQAFNSFPVLATKERHGKYILHSLHFVLTKLHQLWYHGTNVLI